MFSLSGAIENAHDISLSLYLCSGSHYSFLCRRTAEHNIHCGADGQFWMEIAIPIVFGRGNFGNDISISNGRVQSLFLVHCLIFDS